MIDREFKQIDKVVWETSKHILNSLEVKSDDHDLEFFYTPPKSPLQPIFAKLESHMNEGCAKRILLDVHETIVTQVVNTRCACKCPPKTTSHLKKLYAPKRLLLALMVMKD
jgi:flagellar motor switch protein FliM